MSAVSAESPRGSADLTKSSASSAQPAAGPAPDDAARAADFGPNQWLVDELYQRYQADPGSVDQAWWSFFADYHPQPDLAAGAAAGPGGGGTAPAGTPSPAARGGSAPPPAAAR